MCGGIRARAETWPRLSGLRHHPRSRPLKPARRHLLRLTGKGLTGRQPAPPHGQNSAPTGRCFPRARNYQLSVCPATPPSRASRHGCAAI